VYIGFKIRKAITSEDFFNPVLKPMLECSALVHWLQNPGSFNLRICFQPCVETFARNQCIMCIGFQSREALILEDFFNPVLKPMPETSAL
jgi:hypothetical protein